MTDAAAPGAVGRRRFIAPARADVDRACFTHPLFAAFADYRNLMAAADWPALSALNRQLALSGKQLVE